MWASAVAGNVCHRLITIEKGYAGKRARTWVTLTKAGRTALAEEIAHLKLLISRVEEPETSLG